MSSADLSLPPGHSLQEYRIESTLGVGGFGLTYLATDSNLNLKVAIKEYLPTALAVRMAQAAGITLAAIARADGFEVFTHPHRIDPHHQGAADVA